MVVMWIGSRERPGLNDKMRRALLRSRDGLAVRRIRQRRRASNGGLSQGGFTLIEMIIVISIVMILTGIAIPLYRMHVVRAKEAVLKEDLYAMRSSIDQYTQDKDKAPQSLDDLVTAGYLHAIPKDPMTESNSTWEPVSDDSIQDPDQTETGIVDVKSGAKSMGSDGTSYDTW
jgi:general secretion pathway protein G